MLRRESEREGKRPASLSSVEKSEHRSTSADVGEPNSKGPCRAKRGAEEQNRWRDR
jgi:hypothetical protein